jgi:hypothetical protein
MPPVLGLRAVPRLEPVRGHRADTTVAAYPWAASSDLTGADPSFAPNASGTAERLGRPYREVPASRLTGPFRPALR